MADASRKLRILRLLDLLRSETDDEHCLTTVEICERLTAEGYECDRKTLYDDIELLNAYGVAVEKQRCGKGNGYYIADQQFDVSELKIIVDALHAANFINEKKTDALIEKVAKLGGKHKEGAIKAIDVHFNNRKHSSTHTYYNVETIAKAISEKKKISFYAYNLNYKATPVYRHHKKRYTEEPIPHIRFHDLRHSCASFLVSKGFQLKDVQEWLGHSDIETTANIYAHLDLQRKRVLMQSMKF